MTPKAAFCYINVLRDEHKFDKLAVVINGIDLSKRKNTYGYGYGKKYGYGYGKHYGYGYGYDTAMGMVLRRRIRKRGESLSNY